MKHAGQDTWNAALYDTNHSFVSTFGQDLLAALAPRKDEQILDVGCGTGDLAHKIHELGAKVTGIDVSENMIQQAQHKYPHIRFTVRNVTALDYQEEFDAVFSNAALHWIKPQKQALQCIYQSWKQGGRFIAELGGKGNIKMITDEVINQYRAHGLEYDMEQFPWYFPSTGEYASLMEEVGFTVACTQYFYRPTPLEGQDAIRNWLHMFGSGLFIGVPEDVREHMITTAQQNLSKKLCHAGEWIADYKRIRVIGIKE